MNEQGMASERRRGIPDVQQDQPAGAPQPTGLYRAVAALGDLAAAEGVAGLAEEIAALRVLLASLIAGLAQHDGPAPTAQVEAVSRVMGRLGRLLLAHRQVTGAADPMQPYIEAALAALLHDSGTGGQGSGGSARSRLTPDP